MTPLVDGLNNVKISSFTNEMRSCDFRRFGGWIRIQVVGGNENNITVLQMVRIEAGPVISGNNQIQQLVSVTARPIMQCKLLHISVLHITDTLQ